MKIEGIIWLDEILDKLIQKHKVQPHEVIEVLIGSPRFRFIERGHRSKEDVYAAMGQTDDGRYLIIFFVYKTDKSAIIVSARDMTKSERKLYETK